MITKLVLLGILFSRKKPMHGYEIKRQLEEWAVGEYARISYGSIYYNLEKMEKEGLVASRSIKNSRRPERRLYTITEKGKKELMKLLRKNYFETERPYYAFDVGVCLMPLMPREEVLKALAKRIQVAKRYIKELLEEKAELKGKVPFFVLAIIDHYLLHLHAEKKWLEDLKKEVEKTRSYFEDIESGESEQYGSDN